MSVLNKSNVGDIVAVPPFFKDRVVERVIEASLEQSKSSGKPQIRLKSEIVSPVEVMVGETKYVLAGQTITRYLGLSIEITGQAKQSPWASTCAFLEKCELPTEIDTDDPELNAKIESMFANLEFENILSSQENIPKRKTATGGYEVIKDAKGQPIKQGFEWNTFLNGAIGKHVSAVNKPF